jgi:Amt family ammonium transporter
LQDVTDYAFWTFQFTFSAAAATIVAGALVERCAMSAYFYYSLLLSGFVYPVVVHAIWSGPGFLSTTTEKPLFGVGVVDYAGSGVVHVTGGMTALCALFILGPRRGRFHDFDTGAPLEVPTLMPGQSVSLQVSVVVVAWIMKEYYRVQHICIYIYIYIDSRHFNSSEI